MILADENCVSVVDCRQFSTGITAVVLCIAAARRRCRTAVLVVVVAAAVVVVAVTVVAVVAVVVRMRWSCCVRGCSALRLLVFFFVVLLFPPQLAEMQLEVGSYRPRMTSTIVVIRLDRVCTLIENIFPSLRDAFRFL